MTVLVAACAVLAAGCASSGNEVLRAQDAAAVDQNIVDGRTTRNEVERIYGAPSATSFANDQSDIWIYRWSRSTARPENFMPYIGAFVGGADVQSKELVILFNAQSVVVRHSMRDSTNTVRRNLASSSAPAPSTGQVTTSAAPTASTAAASGAEVMAAQAAATPRPAATTPAATTQAAPAIRRAAPAGPSTAALTASSIETGRWTCGMRTTSERRYALNFTVAADRSITIGSYGNAPATVVKASPLTFTAVNPRGDRVVTFTMQADNTLVMTGPSTNSNATFYDEGNCVKGAG